MEDSAVERGLQRALVEVLGRAAGDQLAALLEVGLRTHLVVVVVVVMKIYTQKRA